MPETTNEWPVRVVLLFHEADRAEKEEIKKHLAPRRREGSIVVWEGDLLGPGLDFEKGLKKELERADIALFLVSADSIASEEIWQHQVEASVERAEANVLRFIPVIVRAFRWEDTILGKFSPLPKDGHPITHWERRDEAFRQIADAIADFLNDSEVKIALNQKRMKQVPDELRQMETVFQRMPDPNVLRHADSAVLEGPASFLHFSTYARMLGGIRRDLMNRKQDFYIGTILIEGIIHGLKKRVNLLEHDNYSLNALCQEMQKAVSEFRINFANPRHPDASKREEIREKYIWPFCAQLESFERRLAAFSQYANL